MGRSTRRPAVAAAAGKAPSPSLDAVLAGSGGDADFGSPAFWDAFFAARGDAAFEWYGDWRQLGPLLRPACAPRPVTATDGSTTATATTTAATRPAAALILGCGNSALSAQVHDDPRATADVLSIDNCARAIRGQLGLHARARPGCKWRVADMTATGFEAGSFDVLIDKGGLDALHADDTPAAAAVAGAAVDEAVRLTAPGGTYAVVSLCEPHVLRALLARLRLGRGWATAIAVPPPPPDMAGAALQPLVVMAVRSREEGGGGGGGGVGGGGATPSSPSPPVQADLPATTASLPNAAQLAGVAAVVAAENAARAGGVVVARPAPAAPPIESSGDPWAALAPGRVAPAAVGPLPTKPGAEPRFRATVVDGPGHPPPAAPSKKPPPPPSAAVFIVPQGREHEWLFAAPAGLENLRGQVGADRLIAVALGRGHAFPGGLPSIQAEVGPAVAHLTPAPLRGADGAVPILTLGGEAGLGWRTPVARLDSPLSGTIVVEDVSPPDADAAAACGIVAFRRLVFAGAAGLVQSEAAVVGGGGGQKKKKGGGGGGGPGVPVAGTHLPAAYHTALLAGLAPVGAAIAALDTPADMLVVGLGGGGLAAHAAATLRALRCVQAVELDPAVVEVARAYFGLGGAEAEHGPARLAVRVVDGLDAVAGAGPGSLAAILVDAGGGDGAGAMACPPPPFTTPAFAASAKRALHADAGVLAVNCVSRAGEPVEALVGVLKAHFPAVYEIDVPDDVNRVLLAYRRAPGGGAAPKRGDAAAAAALVRAGLGALGGSGGGPVPEPGACVDGPTLADLVLEMRER